MKLRVPKRNLAFVLESSESPGLPDEFAAVQRALRHPVGTPP